MGALLYSTVLTIGLLLTGISKKLAIIEQQNRDAHRDSIQGREEAALSNFKNDSDIEEESDGGDAED